jgi:hypothetical protein
MLAEMAGLRGEQITVDRLRERYFRMGFGFHP